MMDKKIVIRSVTDADNDFVLEVNRDNVEVLAPMDQTVLQYFKEITELFLIVEVDEKPAAFLIALREGVDSYQSENYRWFRKQYDRFLYVDRIVIAEGYRHMGIGRKLYQTVFAHAKADGVAYVTAEIDTIPYNATSLGFHKAMGFREVGAQFVRNGEIQVSLQEANVM